ncbi:deoxyribodipyrimidine photo-lyase [Coraliomargarita algicola]|uniref:Deoxyribodipyrimidine photo-lyase n=2 Tax=Coraliomargarita algicola TaxID=3092156 RepID=A0ABZ0RSS6_9BACT|nr:deoxyribodipyrimidine photo-lyase [Coraliomargarita sp. J2-16]WPJ98020.1 deoxyribodipyrimidine photo-lyase [Coraliomargarita sp. J2-16]
MSPTLLWFRKDLRLADNSALAAAIELGAPIVPVFIWAPEEAGAWAPGAASKWWLHQALKGLREELRAQGGELILREGTSLAELRDIIKTTGATRVLWNRRYESSLRELDAQVKRALREDGLQVESFNSSLLNEPHTAATGSGQPYKVYTPYWKKVKDRPLPPLALPDLPAMRFPESFPWSTPLESLNLLPAIPWYRGFETHWLPTEAAARGRLDQFLSAAVEDYATGRDRPDCDGTSCLSPYLHWGQIGPRQVMAALADRTDLAGAGASVYAKEIYWREFAYNVLYHFPHTPDQALRAEYDSFPWESDDAVLKAWQMGQTGYPIVDAGMRQLWQTGWMHNRVRMIVSSFLVKHLLHDWRAGAKWFWDTLVDADLASNTLGWQWSGGCGADAAPYFRVFNPILQGQKFDPEGAYVKRYLPELRKMPAKYMHVPWEAPDSILEYAGVEIGKNYPAPIIDHKVGRARALAALEQFKSA